MELCFGSGASVIFFNVTRRRDTFNEEWPSPLRCQRDFGDTRKGVLAKSQERGQPCCSVETFLSRGFQPERLTDISQPRSGWNIRRKRSQVPKGRRKTHVDCFRRPSRTVYPLAPIQALRAWLMSGVAFAIRQAAVPIFSTRQQPCPRIRRASRNSRKVCG